MSIRPATEADRRRIRQFFDEAGHAQSGTVPGAFRSPAHGYVGLHVMHLSLA